MVSAIATARERWSAERFARFHDRPDVKRIARRYAGRVRTDTGLLTMTQVAGLVMLLVAGKLSRAHFKAELRKIGKSGRVPIDDLKIIARTIEETVRCGLYGSGQLAPASRGK